MKSVSAGKISFDTLQDHFDLNAWCYCPVLAYPRVEDKEGVHYNSRDYPKPVSLTVEMKNNFMENFEQELNVQVDELQLDCYLTLAKVVYVSQRAEKVKKCKGNIGF